MTRGFSPRSAPALARVQSGRVPELRGGAFLGVAWILLWAFFVLAVAAPAARLHAGAASPPGGAGGGTAAAAAAATGRS